MPKRNKNLKKQNKKLRNQNKKLKNQIEKYSTQDTKEKDISTYLDFIVFELNRCIRRKDILENKAYILGTSLIAFVSINYKFFNIFSNLIFIKKREDFIFVIFKLITIGSGVISFIFVYFTITISDNSYLIPEEFDIKKRKNKSLYEQHKEIIDYHRDTMKVINERCNFKSKYLKYAIRTALLFFFLFFIFMLGG